MSKNAEQPDLHIDEDWKSKVKAEDAALDAQLKQGEGETSSSETPESDSPSEESMGAFPPADFAGLLMMLSTQAMVGLGMVPMPGQSQPTKNLEMAKYFIDLLAVLEEKTKNRLEREENNMLIETLHQLRIGYVQATRSSTT